MRAWFNFPQIWTNTISSSTKYIDYGGIYYSYDTDAIKYTTQEDVQDPLVNGLLSCAVSTSEAESWFNSMEITTPIKRRGAKMG